MQLISLHKKLDELQILFGEKSLRAVYGAGCTKNPNLMLIFMNPTGRNVSASKKWKGIRAPWLGTKNIWQLLFELNIISRSTFLKTQKLKSNQWDEYFSRQIYEEVASKKTFVTNLAKCTQLDARPLKNEIFKKYLECMREEIISLNPRHIFTFGNQVSSIILSKSISVSNYVAREKETLSISGKTYDIYPVYYPVGQGRRNMSLAVKRIKHVVS